MSLDHKAASRIREFRHHFKGGITCKLSVDLDKLAAKATGYVRCEWRAGPKPLVIPEYRRWILSVWLHIADETGLKLMELLQAKPSLVGGMDLRAGTRSLKVKEVTM